MPPGMQARTEELKKREEREDRDGALDHRLRRTDTQKVHREERYKLTIYRNAEYGEMFDLVEDPNEIKNLWNRPEYAAIKCDLLHRFARADLQREPTCVALRPSMLPFLITTTWFTRAA